MQGDIGRLFTDQVTDLDYPDMFTDAKEVLRTLVASAKAVATHDGRWYIVRIMPYRTYEDKIDGLVITFIDTTISKKLEMALLETQTMLRSFIARVPGVIIGLTVEGIIIEFNPEAEKVFGRKRQDVINKNYVDLFIPEPSQKKVRSDLKQILSGTMPNHFENQVKAVDGEQLNIEWTAHKLFNEKGDLTSVITIGENISKLSDKNRRYNRTPLYGCKNIFHGKKQPHSGNQYIETINQNMR